MCPHCRAFITTDDRVCPYCDTPVGPRAVDRRDTGQLVGGFIPHARFTTTIFLLINFGLYVATALYASRHSRGGFTDIDAMTLATFGSTVPIGSGYMTWWRLVTAGFLHGGLMHILMNSWVLFDLGAQVEEAYGTARMVVFYILSSIAGFYVSLRFVNSYSVGASAAIFGLIGAMIALGTRERVFQALRGLYIRWAVYGLALGFLVPHVDNSAHIGGLAAGFAIGYVAGTPRVRGEGLWKALAALCVALVVFAFWNMYLFMQKVSG